MKTALVGGTGESGREIVFQTLDKRIQGSVLVGELKKIVPSY